MVGLIFRNSIQRRTAAIKSANGEIPRVIVIACTDTFSLRANSSRSGPPEDTAMTSNPLFCKYVICPRKKLRSVRATVVTKISFGFFPAADCTFEAKSCFWFKLTQGLGEAHVPIGI